MTFAKFGQKLAAKKRKSRDRKDANNHHYRYQRLGPTRHQSEHSGIAPLQPRLQTWLKGGYARVLRLVARWPEALIAIVVVICVLAVTRLPFFGGEFLPEFREGHYVLQVSTLPGTSLPEMMRLGREISGALLK